jgi:hypothetical protein
MNCHRATETQSKETERKIGAAIFPFLFLLSFLLYVSVPLWHK